MRGCIPLLLAAAAALGACKSAPAPLELPHPYKVVLLPIEGAAEALGEQPGASDVPLDLTPEELETRIRDRVKGSRVFSEVVVAGPDDLRTGATTDEMQAASELAKRTSSDLILRIEVKSARMTDLGNNGSTLWSTLTWFMLGIPSFWVDDRTYDTALTVRADLYEPEDPVKPTASVDASSQKQDLDLWDRGLSPYVILVPPAFLSGSTSSVSTTLTERTVDQVLAALVEQLRTREIPARFAIDVRQDGAGVVVEVVSRRRLRSLSFESGGRTVETWGETGLVEEKESTPDRFVYRKSVRISAPAGTQVRVIAEDEAGGREVRTLVTGGAGR